VTVQRVGGLELSVAALSDPGLKRAANEDSYLAEGSAFVVADGMGGYECGDLASGAVVAAFRERFASPEVRDFATVHAALLDADDRVAEVAQNTQRGAGSTATGIVAVLHEGNPYWLVFNVGDSRVYRHSGSELEQLTRDHSLGQEKVDAGELRPEDLATFKDRNVITRAIGAADGLADSWLVPAINGERMLLCSDGLHGEVGDEAIRAILTMNGRPETVVRALVDRALANGGRDNVTAVVVDVIAGGLQVTDATGSSAFPVAFGEPDDTLRIRD